MFNLRNFKLVKKLKNINPQSEWIKFSEANNKTSKEEFINSIIADNKFVEEELKMRKMVEEMLAQEFSPEIKNMKSYDFLVDAVINRLKAKQTQETEPNIQ